MMYMSGFLETMMSNDTIHPSWLNPNYTDDEDMTMGKMKAYMMELQEEADYAISEGANSAGEVIMYMRNSGMSHIDEHWVTKYYTEKCGES